MIGYEGLMMPEAPAILVGWKRDVTEHGIVLTMQVARTADDARLRRNDKVAIVLNERQLRSFARDLVRASASRGLDVFHEARGWRRLLQLVRGRRATGAPVPRTGAAAVSGAGRGADARR